MLSGRSPDVQEEPLPVDELHCAGLALDAAGCDVHNISHADLLPRGVLRSIGDFSQQRQLPKLAAQHLMIERWIFILQSAEDGLINKV